MKPHIYTPTCQCIHVAFVLSSSSLQSNVLYLLPNEGIDVHHASTVSLHFNIFKGRLSETERDIEHGNVVECRTNCFISEERPGRLDAGKALSCTALIRQS